AALDPKSSTTITLTKDVTQLLDPDDDKIYKFIGTTTTMKQSDIDFSQSSKWSFVKIGVNPSKWADRDLGKFDSTFENYTFEKDTWTTGGGWLREKTVHTKTTTTSGKKDYYTHYLRADYPIQVGILQSGKPAGLFVNTGGDLKLSGNIKVTDGRTTTAGNPTPHGVIELNVGGSIDMSDTAAIFGASPKIVSGGSVELLMEGDKGALSVKAKSDVSIKVFSRDNLTSKLAVQRVDSDVGNVTIVAPHGITTPDGHISGNRVELDAAGGFLSATIDSNIVGGGGFAARAKDGVIVTEVAGDLLLVQPTTWTSPLASVLATAGNVQLTSSHGAIRDAVYELANTAAVTSSTTDAEMQQQLAAAGLSDDRRRYALSPGLMQHLFPHAPKAGVAGGASTEFLNISGIDVVLSAAAGADQIGAVSGKLTIDAPQNFDSLSLEKKRALSAAGPSDLIGVSYE
ncbi:MAG TPA: hypothetical protein PLV92_24375, partial [Pirellulaceae bacterium]|nr:hypothetical protein [Pirellulaceae bacterium]